MVAVPHRQRHRHRQRQRETVSPYSAPRHRAADKKLPVQEQKSRCLNAKKGASPTPYALYLLPTPYVILRPDGSASAQEKAMHGLRLAPRGSRKEGRVKSIWPTIDADGCTWQVRVISGADGSEDNDIIEFTPDDRTRPVRRLAIARGADEDLGETELHTAFRQSRPIGGDYYGRPGKRMRDAS